MGQIASNIIVRIQAFFTASANTRLDSAVVQIIASILSVKMSENRCNRVYAMQYHGKEAIIIEIKVPHTKVSKTDILPTPIPWGL